MTAEQEKNPSMPDEQPYTEEELKSAQDEIDHLTPEKWIERSRYMQQLEENAQLPEAGGIAFTRLYGQNGGEINITARALTPTKAVIDLLDSVRYVMNWQTHMDWKPSKFPAQAQSAPPAQPAQQFPMETKGVTYSIQAQQPQQASYVPDQLHGATLDFPAEQLVATTSEGKTFWKIKGGKFSKWGVTVWPEVLMAAGIDVNQINIMQPFPLVGLTAHYTVKPDGNPAKVVALTQ